MSLFGRGGLPRRRVDQRQAGLTRAGSGPAPAGQTIIAQRVIIPSGAQGTGLFVYSSSPPAKGNLITQIVAPGVTQDPFGDAVNAVLNIGTWSGAGALLQHFGVDQQGRVYIVGTDGVTRIIINNGFGGTGPDIRFFNDFGAVILVVDPGRGGVFQYQDLGSATQGVLVGAFVTKNTTDPINGQTLSAGINVIDPAFGDSLTVVGANVSFVQALFTRNGIQTANTGSGATSPFMTIVAPEQGHAGHAVQRWFGTSADGTVPGGSVLSLTDPPVRASSAVMEIQGDLVLTGVATPAAPPAGDTRLFSDVTGFLRLLAGLAGDTNTYAAAWQVVKASAVPQTIASTAFTTITGLTLPVGIAKYAFRARITYGAGSNAGTGLFQFVGPANTGPWMNAIFVQNNGGTLGDAQNGALGFVTSPLLTTAARNVVDMEGECTFTAAGTLQVQAAEGTSGDTVIIEQGHLWLYPLG
jgi:hypothetical protein